MANSIKTFLDLFAGIGGFRFGLEMAGLECVGYVECDQYARQSYEAIHDTEGEWTGHDITEISDEGFRTLKGSVDIITAGFPCQAFSIAGRRGGFADTRGTLFFHIARAAEQIQPRFLLFENVKGLLSHDKGETFATILTTLDELGYDAEWQLCNSKDFGVPQNRERVFIIGHLRGTGGWEVFPITRTNSKTLKQLIGGSQGMRVYSPDEVSCTISSDGGGWGAKTGLYLINNQDGAIKYRDNFNAVDANYWKGLDKHSQRTAVMVQPCLTPDREEKRQNGRRFKGNGEPMFTLNTQDRHGVMIKPKHIPGLDEINNTIRTSGKGSLSAKHNYEHIHDGYGIRKLTPLECWRLQGFPDWAFHKAKDAGLSDTQLYRQAGNAVTVNVAYEIGRRLNVG